MKDCNIIQLIDLFQSKARCNYTIDKAERILRELKKRIDFNDHFKLYVALQHHSLGESTAKAELDDVCGNLREKYKEAKSIGYPYKPIKL